MDLIRSRYDGQVLTLAQYLDSTGHVNIAQALEHESSLSQLLASTLVCSHGASVGDNTNTVDQEHLASMTEVITS
jgi:uncharacterized protein YchJ